MIANHREVDSQFELIALRSLSMKSDSVHFTHQLGSLTMVVVLVLSMFAQPVALVAQAASSDLLGPAGSGKFGTAVYTLPNGNFVVTDPEFSSGPQLKIGAVYLYAGTSHNLLNTMTGTTNNDMVGSGGIEILKDGSFVVVSPRWNNGAATLAGAATWCDPTSGCPATVTAANSLVGDQTGDNVGTNWALTAGAFADSGDITPISGSAYLVRSARWGGNKGAVTFCASGSDSNCHGAVSAANSLVGSTGGSPGDLIGLNLKLIPGGGYVVHSSYWSDTVNSKASTGAAVPCPATGCKGVISATNSLHGTLVSEQTAMSVEAFPNGAFVVSSYMWGSSSGLGAVTYCASVSDPNCIGKPISASNSLVGKAAVDNTMISSNGVTILPDGNYVVKSSSWKTDAGLRTGAATFCTVSAGTSSCTGQNVTSANSLIGDWTQDSVGSAVIPLSGGAFLVTSAGWHDWTGAATYCSSIAACIGKTVSSTNSLVGGNKGVSWSNSTGGDQLSGGGIVVLSSGEYMVFSPHWDLAGTDLEKGAVTFCPATGCTGSVSLANSLSGANPNDQVGMASGIELAGGALIIASPYWNNAAISQAGAVTFCSSVADCKGQTVNASNSLVGDQASMQAGYYTNFTLSNGAYLVGSSNWNNGPETYAGALTWCPASGCKGMVVGSSNSLVGSHYYDYVGGYAVDLGDGLYVTQNSSWQDGSLMGAGAVTLCSQTSGCSGPINSANSVIGSVQGLYDSGGDYYNSFDSYNYDAVHHQLLVGLPLENKVVFFMISPNAATQPASSISASGATLNAAVNAMHYTTTVTFEYGLDTSYGSTISASQNPVNGYIDTAISQVVGGLLPGTLYHYRVVAANPYGTTQGLDQTFSTSMAPPSATTEAASSITANAARLNATVNANNASSVVTFEYGLTDTYGSSAAADQSPVTGSSATPVSKDLSGLTASTTYHFRIKAVSTGGTTYGDDLSFKTNSSGPAVTSGTASSITSGGATLNGTVNALSSSTSVTFEYGLSDSYGSSVTADQSPVTGSSDTPVSKAINGLAPNTQYHYRVVGINSNGTSYGLDQTFTTPALAPSAVTSPANGITTSGATLNGTVSAFNASTTVTFEYGLDDTYGTTVTADQSPVTGSSDTLVSNAITGLAPNTQYHYRIVAVNAGGTTRGLDQTFTSAAAKPTAVADPASGITTSGATLNATVNALNASTTVTFEYGLADTYGSSVSADQSPVGGSTNTSVSKAITGLAPNTQYHFRVVAVNAGGTSNGLDHTFSTSAAAPSAVTDSASSLTKTGATLNGTVNALNASTIVTFEYGLTDTYGSAIAADQSPVSGSTDTPVSVAISGLTPATTYHYRVVTVNAGGTTRGTDLTFTTASDVCVAFGNTTVNWSVAFAACPPGTKLVIPPGLNVILDIDVSLNVDLEVQGTLNATSLQKTFTLTGSGSQTLTGNPLTFYRLTVNKDAPSDSVTISGKLKVTKKLTVTRGKLISASDYSDVSIEAEGTLELTNDISVAGDFTNNGTFTANGHAVTFDGGLAQNLTLSTVTSFYDLVVGPGTLLIETETLDNAVISHTLTNLGTIRKTQPVTAADDYYFGLAGKFNDADLAIQVTTLGSLSSLQVDRVDSDHPNALDSSVIQAGQGRYWKITGVGSNYLTNLTLPHNAFSPGRIRVCRFAGAGTTWICQMTDVSSNTITLNGISQSADWAVGNVLDTSALNLGPTKFEILTDWAAGLKLSWNSTMEIDTVGYNIYRSESVGGPYVLLNTTPIAALTPGSTSGNAYSYNDRTAFQGVHYYYRLAPVSPFKGEKGYIQLDSVYYRLILPLMYQ
jgi:phosphodiesterase/alkaline phosphatase D-like protein